VTDAQQAVATETATPEAPAEGSQQEATVEQVEAEWRNRVSQKDRAHAAEAKTLRQQIAALEAEAKASDGRTASEQDAVKLENERLRKQLAERDIAYALAVRKAKYPGAADALDPEVFVAMDEAKLAGLESRLTPGALEEGPLATRTMVPATAPRTTAVPKPLSEKTSAELEADLARLAPDFLRQLGPR
jgi:hypothetical protein